MSHKFLNILILIFFLASCGDSSSNDNSELQWHELNHREDDHHMYISLDNPEDGLTSEQALSKNTLSDNYKQTIKRPIIDSALLANFTEYPGKIVDTRGIGSARVINIFARDTYDKCLQHCANWSDCGSVVITDNELVTNCAFHGPTISDSKFFPGTLPTTQITTTYVFDQRTLPVPHYIYYGDRIFTGTKDGDGTTGPVYVKALYEDKTASDWLIVSNLSKGGTGGEGFNIPDKKIEAVVLTSKTNDAWSPAMYQFLHNPTFSINGGRPFVYSIIYEHFYLKESCGNSPIGGCANSLVLPATSNGIGDGVSLADAEEFRKKYLW